MSPKPDDLCFLSAVVLAARIRAGKVSPVEVIDALRNRIGTVNPKLNAYVHTRPGKCPQSRPAEH